MLPFSGTEGKIFQVFGHSEEKVTNKNYQNDKMASLILLYFFPLLYVFKIVES